MTARAIMVLGTSSHVGKSLVTAALCRIFARAGYRVAPFKAQNMALNSAATPDGHEIGRAQALQAEAAGIAPSVHMNPVLIKPGSDTAAQIVVQGVVWRNLDARNYQETSVANAAADCGRELSHPGRAVRRDRAGGRWFSGRDQSERERHCEHAHGEARPMRSVCWWETSTAAASSPLCWEPANCWTRTSAAVLPVSSSTSFAAMSRCFGRGFA